MHNALVLASYVWFSFRSMNSDSPITIGLSNNISNRSVFNLSLKSHHYYWRSNLRSASPIIVTIWKVVFANKSGKPGWIWMKLGRCGWGLVRFQRNRAMGFGESAKKWVAEALFLWRVRRTTSATFLGSLSAKLPTNTCPGAGSRHMVSYSRKASIKGSNFPKNHLFRVL